MWTGNHIHSAGTKRRGKSTLIKCIAGLLRFKGNITICGHDNKSMELSAGYVPEMPALFLLTVSEHLEFIRRAYRLMTGLCRSLLERFELADKANRLERALQGYAASCPFVAPWPINQGSDFDEPMVGLDPMP